MFLKNIKIIALIVVISPINVYAAYFCTGKVDEVAVSSSGIVTIISSEAYSNFVGRAICSLKELWKGVEPSACKGYLSLLLTNQKMKSPVKIQYTDQNICSGQPEWGNASPPYSIYAQ